MVSKSLINTIGIFLILLFAAKAFACPELDGDYDCKRFIKGYAFAHSVEGNNWEFMVNGQHYYADNVVHPLKRHGVTGTYKSYCSGENYNFYQAFTNNRTGSIQTETTDFYTKNNDPDTLYVNQVFTFGGEDGFILRINDVCKR